MRNRMTGAASLVAMLVIAASGLSVQPAKPALPDCAGRPRKLRQPRKPRASGRMPGPAGHDSAERQPLVLPA